MAHPVASDLPEGLRNSPYHSVVSSAISLLAGTAGGTANVVVGQPLDTVKASEVDKFQVRTMQPIPPRSESIDMEKQE